MNENMPQDRCTVKYPDFEEAIKLCIKEGKGCKISRSDFKAAFRNLCIRKEDFWLLIMKVKSPINGKFYFFVDKCLCFRASISCSQFQRFSNCVTHIMKYRTGRLLVNYLDDYLFCNLAKTFWGMTRLVFLASLIDTVL